jgi:hypothetical protein
VELGTNELDKDNIPDPDDLLSVCAGLVAIDEERGIVRIVHYTTQEYFKRTGTEWLTRAQFEIASTCITHLAFDVFKTGVSISGEHEYTERVQNHEFWDYASTCGGEHVQHVQEELGSQTCSILLDQGLVTSATRSPAIAKD